MDWKPGGARPLDFCPHRPISGCLWVPKLTDSPIALYDSYGPLGGLPWRLAPSFTELVRVKGSDSIGWEVTSWVSGAVHLFRDHADDVRVQAFLAAATNPRLGYVGSPPAVLGV